MSNPRTVDNSAKRLADLKECATLDKFIPLRARLTGGEIALKQFNRTLNAWDAISYLELNERIIEWRKAFASLGLQRGARVSILLNNSVDHVLADQATLANAMIPVPLHAIDTPGSQAFILADSGAECLVTNKLERWQAIEAAGENLSAVKTVILTDEISPAHQSGRGPRIYGIDDFLGLGQQAVLLPEGPTPDDLAAIVYTSGTTGRPKGVMLTHGNIVSNVIATLEHIAPAPQPGYVFLSFLPLSHTFERTAGYYLPLGMGCTIVFNRSIMLLNEDFKIAHPDVLISVPRIYERIYARIIDRLSKQSAFVRFLFNTCVDVGWRRFCRANRLPVPASSLSWLDPFVWPFLKKMVATKVAMQFGGRLKVAIAGGAALNHKVARLFCGLGIPPIQGYGMTEASPIIAGNSLTLNQPETVGRPFPNVEVRLAPRRHGQGSVARRLAEHGRRGRIQRARTAAHPRPHQGNHRHEHGREGSARRSGTGPGNRSALCPDLCGRRSAPLHLLRGGSQRREVEGTGGQARRRPQRSARVAEQRGALGRSQARPRRRRGIPALRAAAQRGAHARALDDRKRTAHAHAQTQAQAAERKVRRPNRGNVPLARPRLSL